jgi:hypothetical protein
MPSKKTVKNRGPKLLKVPETLGPTPILLCGKTQTKKPPLPPSIQRRYFTLGPTITPTSKLASQMCSGPKMMEKSTLKWGSKKVPKSLKMPRNIDFNEQWPEMGRQPEPENRHSETLINGELKIQNTVPYRGESAMGT